jgi:hypothetical protein
MRFLRTYIVLHIFSFLLASQAEAQTKKQTPLVLYLPSSGKILTVPAAPLSEQQYWANNWQHYADTDSTDAIVMSPGILGTMLLPGYSPTKITQQYLDSLSIISSEALPIYYDTTQGFWKTLWEEQKKEYEASERRIQNIAVIVRRYGKEISARDTATQRLEILAVVPLVRARAYKLPPNNSDIALPYLMTEEARRNNVYSYGGTPLARLAAASDKILTRAQLKKIVFPKEGSRSRDTLYSVIAEEVRKNTLQTTRRMIVPESPIVIFDKLQKIIIRCVVSTGRFLVFPGSFTVKIEGNSRLPKYKVVRESLTSVSGNIDQPCGVSIIFEEPFWAGEQKLLLEYRSHTGIIDTASILLKVLSSSLEPRTICFSPPQKLYYGKRVMFDIRSVRNEIELLNKDLIIQWQCGNQKRDQAPYHDRWVGPNIPALAKKVLVLLIWKYPVTGELVPLFLKETYPEQIPPAINSENVISKSKPSADSSEVEVQIRKIFVDYAVPIDADSLGRSIKATLADVKFDSVALSSWTQLGLAPINASTQATQKISPNLMCRVEVLGTEYNPQTAEISVRVRIRKPQNSEATALGMTRIQGIVALEVSASIVNTKAGTSARSNEIVQIPVKIGN